MADLSTLVSQVAQIKTNIQTCHTNLKNVLVSKGVTVDSSDRIQDLINKVKNMSSGFTVTEIKDTSQISLNYNYSRQTVTKTITFETPLKFHPAMAFVNIGDWKMRMYSNDSDDIRGTNVWFSDQAEARLHDPDVTSSTHDCKCKITSMSSTSITISVEAQFSTYITLSKIILIGDANYDLDAQIKKKVKVSSTLPSSGTNGDLVIIGNPAELTTIKIVDALPSKATAKTNEVYIVEEAKTDQYVLDLSASATTKKVNLKFIYIYNGSSFVVVDSYFRKSSAWNKLPSGIKYIYQKGTLDKTFGGGLYGYGTPASTTSWSFNSDHIRVRASYYSSSGTDGYVNLHFGTSSDGKAYVDFDGYKKLNIKFSKITGPIHNVSIHIYTSSTSNSYPDTNTSKNAQYYFYNNSASTPATVENKILSANISSMTGSYFVSIQVTSDVTSGRVSSSTYCEALIESIYLSLD